MNSWVHEAARGDAPSYCDSSSPPPYTPLPLSGHVTLMLSHDSPAKRQASVDSTAHNACPSSAAMNDATTSGLHTEASNSALDISYHGRQTEAESFSERVPTTIGHCTRDDYPITNSSPTTAVDIPDHPRADFTNDYTREHHSPSQPSQDPPLRPLGYISLSSSFPSARPPSPFPRARTASNQLPPLMRIQPPEHRRASTPGIPASESFERTPFRLPPLALQRLPPVEGSGSYGSGPHSKRTKKRVRSQSCQIQTSGLSSVQEHTVAIIQ